MKRSSKFNPGRFAMTGIAAAVCCAWASSAFALGLGRMQVQSALGEALRAEIEVTSLTPEEAANLRVKVASPDAYKVAGVDYNAVLPGTRVEVMRRADGRPYLRLTSDRGVQEPFVDVILEMNWASGRLVREYTMLFDPPATARTPAPPPVLANTAPAQSLPAVVATPRLPDRRVAASPPPPPAFREAAPAPAPARTERAPVAAAAAPSPSTALPTSRSGGGSPSAEAGSYRVRPGDSLSRIATKTQRPGVSLDQMLVSLFRGNSQAFIGDNMNRLRSGVVLSVPTAETARATAPDEARQVVQAQSADFGAYRQRLASGVLQTRPDGSARQAGGKVQAEVDERRAGVAAAPDRLTLSSGRPASDAAAPSADAAARERTRRADDLRLAEAARLAAAASAGQPARPTPTPPTVASNLPSPAPSQAMAPVPAAAPIMPPIMPPPSSSVIPAPPPQLAASGASLPSLAGTAASVAVPTTGVLVAATPPASAPGALGAAPPPRAVAPLPGRSAASASEEPGALGSLLDDNPLAIALGGLALAALVAFGIWRYARRSRADSSETSFLESRLQPDSFFGASGGQRIDTRDGAGTSSSMSYSLSQLDAIGDVDPVAEADVYLAYGRDLQAEEILKEAMRSTPDRLAIRTKLLEVYAKRRDTKGFELLATQLFALTRSEGEDWQRAQELGAQIDPDNGLYRPGGAPAGVVPNAAGHIVEPLGASTMPQSVLPSPSQFGHTAPDSRLGGLDLDLDLDLDAPSSGIHAPPPATPAVDRFAPTGGRSQDAALDIDPMSIDFSAPDQPLAPPPAPLRADTSNLTLNLDDLPGNDASHPPAAAEAPSSAFGDSGLAFEDHDDPLSRKLELADEFRQIGDHDGARELLREVVSKASGSVKSRAQSMLADLE